jgi:hypothetical protein
VSVQIRSTCDEGDAALALLKGDFERFDSASPGVTSILLEFVSALPERTQLLRIFKTRLCTAFGVGFDGFPRFDFMGIRRCDYGAVVAESRFVQKVRRIVVAGKDVMLLREVGYTAILSAIGEALDVRGVHRIHAFGFETLNGTRGLFVAPSGYGKSALALLLCIQSATLRLFSDESPLLKGRILSAFPTRLALLPEVAHALKADTKIASVFHRKLYPTKSLVPFPVTALAQTGPLDLIFFARPSVRQPLSQDIGALRATALLFGPLVMGLGLAQMSEWMLRASAPPRILKIALSRFITSMRIASAADRLICFEVSADANENAARLMKLVSEHERGVISAE